MCTIFQICVIIITFHKKLAVNNSEKLNEPSSSDYIHRYPKQSTWWTPPYIHYIHRRSPGTSFGDLLRSVMPFHLPSSIRQGRHLKPNTLSNGKLPTPAQKPVQLTSGCLYVLMRVLLLLACAC